MLAESGRSKFQLNWLENKMKCGAVNMIGLTYFVCTGKIHTDEKFTMEN
jgi:hypothetical protein